MENEEKNKNLMSQSKTRSTGVITLLPAADPDFVIFPKEGKIVRKGAYKGRSYMAGHKIPYPSDFAETYAKFLKMTNDPGSKVKCGDFEKYFDVISFKDYTNPAYLCDFCHNIGEVLPEAQVAPSTEVTAPGEFIKKFVKVESGWYALVIAGKADPSHDTRAVYLSGGGYAVCSTDVESLSHGRVPELCYLIDSRENPKGFVDLDISYYDGTHNDFLDIYHRAALGHLQDLKGTMSQNCPNFEYIVDYDIEEVQKAYENGRAEAQKRFGN